MMKDEAHIQGGGRAQDDVARAATLKKWTTPQVIVSEAGNDTEAGIVVGPQSSSSINRS
jgi:hypothetical protein